MKKDLLEKIKEKCEWCGREYDGSYPCPCGSKDFVKQNKTEEVKKDE